ncbi:MAG: urea carboxylase-associated family protein [Acidiferrobacterales bacterium]|nr:urea carboxylase-associated family protein [Acidiferrobacterales bacterium]
MTEATVIPARQGKAAIAKKGQSIRIINTHGNQVVDTWAFNLEDLKEFQSNEHTRTTLMSMTFRPGDSLYTNKRRAILEVEEDTSGGAHDLLMAACDGYRYRLLGCAEYHDNCTDNMINAMKEIGDVAPEVPCPMNLFMNIPWTPIGGLSWQAPISKPGDYVQFRAAMDCVMVFSACPQDILPVNGAGLNPTEAHFSIF